ncbi:hypothetical protein JTE90_000895 [Oedothorax gibbosus]|uniref:Methylosome subunit pICln n=1 Tax=Oedothorax gibbosus TaxID=931172 RepID=A0AAV6VVK0_9ARAC|nr:hypothetical protein JTE90_000895 [Oedothorax gibbosus]
MVLLLNFPAPSEGVHHSELNTKAFWNNEELGKGTLYISESVLCWISSEGKGFSLQYLSIFIHAVSTDITNFPEPCLYLMVDGKITLGEDQVQNNGHGDLSEAVGDMNLEEEDEVEGEERPNELRFVPDNRNMLDVMFKAMLDCQALNPDPNEPEDDGLDDAVIAPPFNIQVSNGNIEDFEDEYEDEEDEDEQFEDAES